MDSIFSQKLEEVKVTLALRNTTREKLPVFFPEECDVPLFLKSGEANGQQLEYLVEAKLAGQCTRATVEEMLNRLPVPVKAKVRKKVYIVAKGFIGELKDDDVVPIFVVNASRNSGIANQATWKAYVCNAILKDPDHKPIRDLLINAIAALNCPVQFREDIRQDFGRRIEIPAFPTLSKRKEYIKEKAIKALNSLKGS